MNDQKNSRRNLLRRGAAAAGILAGSQAVSQAADTPAGPVKKVHYRGPKPAKSSFSGAVSYGNLHFIAGKGATTKATSKPTPRPSSTKSKRNS